MATTLTSSTRDLVSRNTIAFIRPQTLRLTAKGVRPNSKLFVFFDRVLVNHLVTPSGGVEGGNLISNGSGFAQFNLRIPAGVFNVGRRDIVVTDVDNLDTLNVVGNTGGSASATFTTMGIEEIYQTTITNTTVRVEEVVRTTDVYVTLPAPPPVRIPRVVWPMPELSDPLAQSFFTYGVEGGCFLTSIELWFFSKDPSIPVSVEIREMVNGYPSSRPQSDPAYIAWKSAADINVSTNASVSTKFVFPQPAYLEQDRDYCFVVHSNSNKYNIFTSKMGEKSYETGQTIFEQPFVGSLFKSENKITWTAEQLEDIKFKLNIAQFTTGSSNLSFVGSANSMQLKGSSFSTTSGSNIVTVTSPVQHGFRVNDQVSILTSTTAATNYNGYTGSALNGNFGITIIDDYKFSFAAAAGTATSTGTIDSCGYVQKVAIENGGSGYSSTTLPTITISAPPTGYLGSALATATAVVTNGAITDVVVTNPGIGYTAPPTVTVTSGSGSNAKLKAVIDATFTVAMNKPAHRIVPSITHSLYKDTRIDSVLNIAGTDSTLDAYNDFDIGTAFNTSTTNLVMSRRNEALQRYGEESVKLDVTLTTTNPNVSPVINLAARPTLGIYANTINNQADEDIDNPDVNTEVLNDVGTAYSRYITKPINLSDVSTGVRVLVDLYSTRDTSVDWYIKTSLSGGVVQHKDAKWQLLKCDVERNKSSSPNSFHEYTFYLDDMAPFDTYNLKCVMRSVNPAIVPLVNRYRVIVIV